MKQSVVILIAFILVAALAFILLTNQQIVSLLKSERVVEGQTLQTEEPLQPILAGGKVQAACQLLPDQSVELSFNANGLIEEILVVEGDKVETGQVIARLDGIKQAEAELISANRAVEDARSELERLQQGIVLSAAQALKDFRDAILAEKNARNLVKRLQDADKPDDEIAQAEAALALARAQLTEAEEEYERRKNGPDPVELAKVEAMVSETLSRQEAAEETLKSRELRAPFPGTVIEFFLSQGEFAGPGTPILLLANLDKFNVETTNLSELNILDVKTGEPATVTFDALREVPIPGSVRLVQPLGKNFQGDIIYKVIIDGDFAQQGLLWGMSCSVVIGE
jgi:multidrug resistance efflux pump